MHIPMSAITIPLTGNNTSWAPLPQMCAAVSSLYSTWYGFRLADEWHHARYHVWDHTRYIPDAHTYKLYTIVYEYLHKKDVSVIKDIDVFTIYSILKGHGTSERIAKQHSSQLFQFLKQSPFLPYIFEPEQHPPTKKIKASHREGLVWLSSLVSKNYYFGSRTDDDSALLERSLNESPYFDRSIKAQQLKKFLSLGMVLLVQRETSQKNELVKEYARLTKRTLFYYPNNTSVLKEKTYPVLLPNNEIVYISNYILTALCMAQHMLIIDNIESLPKDLSLLLEALFAGEVVTILGTPLHISKPPIVLGSTKSTLFTSINMAHVDIMCVEQCNILFC